ncbi:AAA family ATPase, partial [Acidithiobacillus sp. MC6.1]|nr:AAA family ATPase [Acidithiobacillus sp. MC6.1]
MNEENWKPLDLHGAFIKNYITPERYAKIVDTGEIAVRNHRMVVNKGTAERHPTWRAAVEDGWIGRFNNEGYDKEREYFLREVITEALQRETAAEGGLATIRPASALTMMETEPPPLDFVLGGFLRGSVGILTAPGSTGKSFFALELALDIASGADLLQLQPTVGRVTYVSLEDGLPVLHHRIHAIGRHIPANCRTHIDENLQLLPCLGTRIDIESEAETVMERCRDHRLIIIDTLSKAHSYEENSNSEMSRLMVTLDRIALTTGAGVLFLHHVAKGADGSGQHAARGASAIT